MEPADICLSNLKWQVQVQGIKQTEEQSFVPTNDEPRKFKQFDIVNDYSDHYFAVGTGNQLILSQVCAQFLSKVNTSVTKHTVSWFIFFCHSYQVKKGWFKRVQQEWCALKVDLPGVFSFLAFS